LEVPSLWALAEDLVEKFAQLASPSGWIIDFVDDDDFVLFMRPLSGEVHAEMGLDLTRREFGLSLNPALSVRHVPVSDLTARFFGFERGAAQLGQSLSDMVRQQGRGSGVMWTVSAQEDIESTGQRILDDVRDYGEQQFFSQYSSLREIVIGLEQRATSYLDLGQLSVANMVAGRHVQARSVLLRIRGLLSSQPPLLQHQIERFLGEFEEHFGNP
jgi:hypothetical protein